VGRDGMDVLSFDLTWMPVCNRNHNYLDCTSIPSQLTRWPHQVPLGPPCLGGFLLCRLGAETPPTHTQVPQLLQVYLWGRWMDRAQVEPAFLCWARCCLSRFTVSPSPTANCSPGLFRRCGNVRFGLWYGRPFSTDKPL
jgi:hypothetical protein